MSTQRSKHTIGRLSHILLWVGLIGCVVWLVVLTLAVWTLFANHIHVQVDGNLVQQIFDIPAKLNGSAG